MSLALISPSKLFLQIESVGTQTQYCPAQSTDVTHSRSCCETFRPFARPYLNCSKKSSGCFVEWSPVAKFRSSIITILFAASCEQTMAR